MNNVCCAYYVAYQIHLLNTDVPSPPQVLDITAVAYHGNHSTISVTWMKNESYIDYYHYQLSYHSAAHLNMSVSDTTNTSALITDVPTDENLTLSLTAHNCAGKSSTVIANVNISGKNINWPLGSAL